MPDHFFEGGSRKRKRTTNDGQRPHRSSGKQVNGYKKQGRQSNGDVDRRKGGSTQVTATTAAASKRRAKLDDADDEELDDDEEGSDDDDGDAIGGGAESDTGPDTDEELDARETAGQKRLRLAKQYLEQLKADQPGTLSRLRIGSTIC